MVEEAWHRSEAGLDVSQGFSKSQLRECHCPELVQAGKRADTMVAVVSANAGVESP